MEKTIEEFKSLWSGLRRALEEIVVGHKEVVEGVMIALFAGGHILLEGVPGIGKTLLVRAVASCCNLKFARVQFTPDLMPSDITGTEIVVETDGRKSFVFSEGPIFVNVLLADEINRATPKTQSALLEAMQEYQVTVGKKTYPLQRPFFVIATQNPIEMEGTYPLPEAQLDRFLFKLLLSMSNEEELVEILRRTTTPDELLERVDSIDGTGTSEVVRWQKVVRGVVAADVVLAYISRLVSATHPNTSYAPASVKKYVRYGASPRAAQALTLGGKVLALADGRMNLAVEDVRRVMKPALRHRLILNFDAQVEDIAPERIIEDIAEAVSVG